MSAPRERPTMGFNWWLLLALPALLGATTTTRADVLVTGTVRDRNTLAPLAGVRVQRFVYFGISGVYIPLESVLTNASGSYTLEGAPSSPNITYVVAGGDGYVKVNYPDRICHTEPCPGHPPPGANLVQPATGIDFLTERAGSVDGIALRAGSGTALTGGTARLRTFAGPRRTATVQPDGTFRFDAVVPGSYALSVFPEDDMLLERFYPATDLDVTHTFEDAHAPGFTPLMVAPDTSSNATLLLSEAACLQGAIASDRNQGVPPVMSVLVKRLSPASPDEYRVATVSTEAGHRAARLRPGTVRVQFANLAFANAYRPNYFPDRETEFESASVTLMAGACVSNVNATVSPRYSISGTVRDAISGTPLAGVPVVAERVIFGVPSFFSSTTHTDQQGRYVLQGFDRPNTNYARAKATRGYAGEAYLDRPYSSGSNTWTSVEVIDGQHRTGVDFTLDQVAFVSGQVVGRPRELPTSIELRGAEFGTLLQTIDVAPDGAYFSQAVTPGSSTYRIVLRVGARRWAHPGIACTTDACNESGATVVTISELREYPGYDFNFEAFDSIFRGSFE